MLLAGFVFLLPVQNAEAAANLTLTTSFTSADPVRANAYMDQAGTWNGTSEVTNSTANGDRFRLTIQNTGVGVTDAFDVGITISLPTGFRLPNTGSTPVTVTSPTCNTTTGVTDYTPINASQSGTTINFNIPNNRNIPAGCTYVFTFGITTRNSSPFPTPGARNLTYNVAYDDGGPGLLATTVQTVQVNPGVMALTKTALTAVATNGNTVDFRIDIRNTGTGGAFAALLTDTISANFTGLTFVSFNAFNNTTNAPVAMPTVTVVSATQRRFNYIPPNVRIEVVVRTTATVNPTATTCPVFINDATVVQRTTQSSSNFASVEYNLPNSLQLTHNMTTSYCELCGIGTVRLRAANAGGISLVNISITENLMASGLTYVPGSTQISLNGGPAVAAANPIVSGANGQILTWTPAQIPTLNQLDSPYASSPPNPVSIEFIFQVRRNTAAGFTEQNLVTAIRNIEATSAYDLICGGPTQNTTSGIVELPIRQPVPVTTKLGRNVDAGQSAGNYAPIIYGHTEDDIIWRVEVQNTGLANMQDLLLDDTITGNFDINYICNSEAAATAAAAGAPPATTCVSAGGGVRTSVLNFNVDDPFGNPANDEPATFIDAPVGGSAFIYYVGRILAACSNQTNSANIEWGCEVNAPDGGITVPATTGGVTPANTIVSTANMSTNVVAGGVNVAVALTGSNQAQPLGTKGIVTVTIANNSGGTVRLWNGTNPNDGVNVDAAVDDNLDTSSGRTISFRDILPTQYVMDRTFTPTAVMAPAYGAAYPGMVDRIIHTNPITAPLANTAPRFRLYSSTTNTDPLSGATYSHLIRNGDVLTVQFGIILVDSTRYDRVADLTIAPEVSPGTDPTSVFTVSNQFTLNALSYCSANPTINVNANYPANLEDLDVNTSSALYILTNDPGTPLPLTTIVTNNGGHDADDYSVYITFGQAMTVQTVPAGCAATTNPPPHPVWNQPAFIPASASVYRCDRGVIAPGATQNFTFQVVRNAVAVNDDLTFRADVVGEITQSNGALLTFPTPASIANTTPNQQLANNYTLDGIRARVLGFNLTKVQSTTCTEDPPGATPDLLVRIGEDCDYFIHAGGWFGFDTPGFTLISVQDMLVTDALPNGQGFINTDDGSTSDMFVTRTPDGVDGLVGISRNPAVLPALTEGNISWSFNTGAADALIEKDKFFNLNIASRLLNDPVDPLYQPPPPPVTPNVHAATSTNIARASFNANYVSDGVTSTFCVSDTANVPVPGCIVPPGFPVEAVRRIDLRVTEPNLLVTKEVCNETLYGTGPACTNFVTLPAVANDGDTQDFYIYRVTITNEATSGGLARAPAFNVIVTNVLDSSDLMMVAPGGATPFDTDGLDNDGDGLIDAADTDGEFFSLTENVANGVTPATFVISNTHSVPLQRIDAGNSVTFYYRIDPADAVAPQQMLSSTVSTIYDSLAGDSGNQHAPQLTNAETTSPNNTGRARIYDAFDDTASIQILPLQTQPKAVITVSSSPYTGSPQNVVVGEEVRYQLHAQIPVANLRNFRIRDELPPGVRCVDAQTINLNAAPYSAAGFVPGGSFAATCTSTGTNDVVEWNFGNQQLTTASSNNLFDFYAAFIARVDNTAATQEGCNLRNGGSTGSAAVPPPAACSTNVTLTRLTYVNEASTTVTLNYAAADLVVREPVVSVTKSFAPITAADADDLLLVTVTATNSGTAPAYNLQILDDLVSTNMTYVAGSVAGTTPPDNVDVATLGVNQPIFNWDNIASAGYVLDPAETITFTFRVRAGQGVNPAVQPHEILNNTIQARWTSLLSVNTALPDIDTAAARTLAADGDVLGMRNGQLIGVVPTSTNPPNDYNATATASVVVPQLTITKNDLNPAVAPAIGEHKQFQIILALPEGVSNNVTVTDNLDALVAAGESYVLEKDATYDIIYTFQGIEFINGVAPPNNVPLNETAFNAFLSYPADETSGTATWNIGTVDTTSENDLATTAINPQIIINYYARINNDVVTDVGDNLQNDATLNYTNGETTGTEVRTDNTPAITVVEPLLTVNKVWSNVTPGKALGDQPDAGDILEYEVTIDNNGNSTAFDINIRDTIPASVQLDGTFTATAEINAVAVAGFVAAPLNAPTGPLIWGRGNADETLDLPAGDTLILTYRVIVQNSVETSQIITNSVVIDWTSLNGANPLERNGGSPVNDCTGVIAPNDYCAGPATATATVPNPNALTKVASVATLRIGDTVQYTITMNLQEGTTRNVSMVDTLPNGMELVSVDSVDGDATAPYSQAGSGDNVSASPLTHADIVAPVVTTGPGANTITWTIGDVVNVADNNVANDNLVIVYTARVVNDEIEPVQQPAPTNPQETLTNSANAAFYNVSSATLNISDSESIVAVQPIFTLANISKQRRSNADHNILVASGTSVASGEIMHFHLNACNTGNGAAYDVVVDDNLEYPLLPGTIAGLNVYVNGALAAAGSDYTYTLTPFVTTTTGDVVANMNFVFNGIAVNPVTSAPNNCILIEYEVQVDPTFALTNQSWDNNYQITQYHSLPATDPAGNVAERETWGPVGPVVFNMNNLAATNTFTLLKSLQAPVSREATIGETVTYQITVPGSVLTVAQNDVTIADNLDDSLVFVSASLDASSTCSGGVNACAITNTTGVGTDLAGVVIGLVEAGEQAVVNVVARVANNPVAQNTLPSFGNTASYTFAASPGGSQIVGATGSTNPVDNISIVEPQLTLASKTVANITSPGNPPDAGDILRYTLTINAAGGATFSDAFDVSIIDTLGLGLLYSNNPATTYTDTFNAPSLYTNTLVAPATNGANGISAQQVLTWSLVSGTDIDIGEGDSVTISYDVVVLDSVLANQSLSNSAQIQWTGINGDYTGQERDGSNTVAAQGGLNDYFNGPQSATLVTPNNNTITKTRVSDTYNNLTNDVRVGDVITYQLELSLQEGLHPGLVVNDVLPQGLVFVGIQSINGDSNGADDYAAALPFSYLNIPAGNITVSGDPAIGATTLSINMGDVTNTGDNVSNNTLSIFYTARVLNNDVHSQVNNIALQNSATFDYTTATGVTTSAASTAVLDLRQPTLTVTKTATQEFGDTIVVAGENITYTVTVTNTGTAPAYDMVLRDTLPFGMRLAGATTVSIETPVGTPLAIFAPTYNGVTGVAEWNFDNGVTADTYSIQPGQSLRIVYATVVDVTVGAGVTLNNSAQVQLYYSFDDDALPVTALVTDREVYGPTAASMYSMTTPAPSPLAKLNPVNTDASIGQPFTYRITVPATPVATALYDVRILDDLGALAPNVDLIFVSVSKVVGSLPWVPVNTGTDTSLVIEDTTTGIDIPAGEQIEIDLTVVVRNTSNNSAGDVFQNTASYTYNSVNDDAASQAIGGGATTTNMTIVEPLSMYLEKTAPVTMQYGTPGTYVIDVQNTGTGPAYDLTIIDHLPDPVAGGGMCDTAPNNFVVVTRDATNVLQQTLASGVDYTTTFTTGTTLGTLPTCTLAITMQSANAVIQSGWHLVVNYDAHLDLNNVNGATLTNYAAATQWFSADTPAGQAIGEIREYPLPTDPNAGFNLANLGTDTINDDEDLAYTTVAAPELEIIKSVYNVATNLYASTAEAGERLRYEIVIRNIGTVAATNFSLHDDFDRLNPVPGFFDPNALPPINVQVTDGDLDGYILNVNPTGGTQGTGSFDVTGLDLAAPGLGDDTFIITFEATLRPVIDTGNVIRNQAEVTLAGFSTLVSDDPSSAVANDPTQTLVGSTPFFKTEKRSDDVTGDPAVLNRGDVLVYTITIKNIGAEDATVTYLYDQIPANTTYVPNTTTLNGVFMNDPSQGVSPLETGMLINAPGGASGFMRANADPVDTTNIATVTFNVMINDNVINGAVISNQAYVGGVGVSGAGFAEQLSDDPETTQIIGDPTRDIVGNVAILDAQKTVTLFNDANNNEQLDPGDTIRYTIAIHNNGLVPATGVVLTDNVSTGLDVTNITYVPDSLELNGVAVGPLGATTLPLTTGINVSSSDLPAPVDLATAVISPGESAVIVFEATVNTGVVDGTVISNQAEVTSNEYPDELTDADGNDINGDQPTLITVGSSQQLTITKNVFVVGGGSAQPGDQLEFLITVTNSGNTPIDLRNSVPNPAYPGPGEPFYIPNPVTEVLKLIDDIDQPGLISYVSGSARLNGINDPNVVYLNPRLTVNYDDSKRSLSNFYQFRPGDSFSVRYRVTIDASATQGDIINNVAGVDWGTASGTRNCTAPGIPSMINNVDACAYSSLSVGGAPGVATLSGKAWHDSNFDEDDQLNERPLAGWEVQIYFGNGTINPGDYVDSVLTDVNGNYSVSGLIPNFGDTKQYALRFVAPGASTDTASLGNANSIFSGGDGPQQINYFDVGISTHIVNMNMPIQPNGVVYNVVTRTGVAGAILELTDAIGNAIPSSCFNDPAQQNQRTLADGFYKFELNFSDALCPAAGADYLIRVYPPAGYVDYDNNPLTNEVSRIIPPVLPVAPTDASYDVCTSDAINSTIQECELHGPTPTIYDTPEYPAPTSVAPRTQYTDYYLKLNLRSAQAEDQLYNHHIPVDPDLGTALGISKTSAMVNVTRSQLVPYTITVTNTLGAPLFDINIQDDYPAGFKYVAGSSRIYVNNVRVTNRNEEPVSLVQGSQGRSLTWPDFIIYENDVITIKMLLVVGAGVGEGEYVNLAHALNTFTLGNASAEASATVRVVPDPTFDCSDIIGKVFNDKNLNGYADEGEEGIAGARVNTAQGLQATTDEYGRYHFTCAVIPNQDRGSNFIVKLDERSLPTGYRVTSENPRTQRATRGKMLKYNFGAAIHHVVRLDMMDAVFKPNTTEIRLQWLPRIDMLISELAKDHSILRLSYLAENEDKSLVNDRLAAVKEIIEKRWHKLNCCYKLMIETEVFWRKGGPVDKGALE